MLQGNEQRVVLWVPRYWPAMGGTELHTHELAIRLSRRMHVDVLTHCDPTANLDTSRQINATSHRRSVAQDQNTTIFLTGFRASMRSVMGLLARLRDENRLFRPLFKLLFSVSVSRQLMEVCKDADIIHFVYNGLSDSVPLAANVAARQGIPFVFTPNICDTSGKPTAWNSTAFINLYKSASHLIALTQHEADWMVLHGANPARISIVPYGPIFEGKADSSRFRQRLDLEGEKLILFLGRVVPIKGYDLLLEARSEIWKKHPDAKIVYMGPVVQQAKADILAAADERVILIENISQEEKCDALAACDLLCVPSRSESLGVVFIEAAFHAKPVVALDIPVLHDVIKHGKDGYLVSHDSSAVATAVLTLLDNPELSKQLGEHAKAKAEKLYTWDAVTVGISDVYRTALVESTKDNYNRASMPRLAED